MSKKLDDVLSKIDKLQEGLDKKHGKGSFFRMGANPKIDIPKIRGASLGADIALGGGHPRGRIIEIYGPESSGKTTYCVQTAINCQKDGGLIAFIDAEHAFDRDYAATLGLDVDNMYISQPDYGEQALEILNDILLWNVFDMIVVDSVAALVPKAEIEGEMGDATMATQARLMSQAMRKIVAVVNKSDCSVFFINQLRSKIGGYGNPETTTGGNALKFYASQRLDVRKSGEWLKDGEETIGFNAKIKVVKNKVAPPMKTAKVKFIYNVGFSEYDDVIDFAIEFKLIEKAGAWYKQGETSLAQGLTKMRQFLIDNPEMYQELYGQVLEKLKDYE